MKKTLLKLLTWTILTSGSAVTASQDFPVQFLIAEGSEPVEGAVHLHVSAFYTPRAGYGFDLGTRASSDADPFYFSVSLPDGNYRVTIEFGRQVRASSTTVRSESRRLMLEEVAVAKGATTSRSFIVNKRNDKLTPPEPFAPGGSAVVLNDRENGKLVWDDKLTLEFGGRSPAVRSILVEPVEVPTIYLVGDSTVSDQRFEPAASWGQMLPRFFNDEVAVANHAESGETIKSFISGLRLAKVLEQMTSGDYLFIQFTHNDQKEHWPQTYVEASTTYKAYLKVLIEEARLRGATPVLVTSMQRRRFDDEGRVINSLGDYPEAMREVAADEIIALIDLEAMSVELYEALGPEKAPLAFNKGGTDATHHNNYGAYQLAKCVAQGTLDAGLPLADYLVNDFAGFDPAHPDDVDTFYLAPSMASDPATAKGH
jgi:lysophospholipase L1-like esterase